MDQEVSYSSLSAVSCNGTNRSAGLSEASTTEDRASTNFDNSYTSPEDWVTDTAAAAEGASLGSKVPRSSGNLRCLLLRTRAALLRLRECRPEDDGASNLSSALAGVNDWLEAAEQDDDDETSLSISDDDQEATTASQIRTWTPGSNDDTDGDTVSAVSSLASASCLIPTELLRRLDRSVNRQSEQQLNTKGKPAAEQPPAGRPPSLLRRCLLARPPSAALSGWLLRGRGLLKSETGSGPSSTGQCQQLKRQRPSRVPPAHRTLFSTVSHPPESPLSPPPMPAIAKRRQSKICPAKPQTPAPGGPTRILGVVRHNDTGLRGDREPGRLLLGTPAL